mgnify:CR=1 FL=1
MSVDCRPRRYIDLCTLGTDESFGRVLPAAIERHGNLALRGMTYKQLPGL